MKILFVVNQPFAAGNGLSASARRTVDGLRAAGEDVRFLSAANHDPQGEQPHYVLPLTHIPVFQGLVERQGYEFAKADDAVITEALKWADVVHIEEPFFIQMRVCRLAKRMGVPMTATFHLHPENLFSSIDMQWSRLLNHGTMWLWRSRVFNACRIVQCPTEGVRRRLARWHFKPELRVISNGLIPLPHGEVPEREARDGWTLISTGRYSVEKDQKTLLRAMRYSRHADRIQIVLAGRGPREAQFRRFAERLERQGILKKPVEFRFCTFEELQRRYHAADLYIHCAQVEVEGLACLEAVATGLVPVIAEGPLTSASQFARSGRSRYPAGNARALAERIDDWLDHPEERRQEAERYRGMEKDYEISRSIEQLRQMFRDACKERKEKP